MPPQDMDPEYEFWDYENPEPSSDDENNNQENNNQEDWYMKSIEQ